MSAPGSATPFLVPRPVTSELQAVRDARAVLDNLRIPIVDKTTNPVWEFLYHAAQHLFAREAELLGEGKLIKNAAGEWEVVEQ